MFPTDADVIHMHTNFLGGAARWFDSLEYIDGKLLVVTASNTLSMLHFLRAQVRETSLRLAPYPVSYLLVNAYSLALYS